MKIEDVKIGGLYRAKVSGLIVTVKVKEKLPSRKGRVQRFLAINTRTMREITVTAARLRRECAF
jgi:hypothetical protein